MPHTKEFGSLKEWENAVAQAKSSILNEWDEHLARVHPRQWEREQRKRARPHAAAKRSAQKKNGIEGH
jgi:hypothetical protein